MTKNFTLAGLLIGAALLSACSDGGRAFVTPPPVDPGDPPVDPVSGSITVKVLSNRADMISRDDAFVEVEISGDVDPASIAMDVDGVDVTEQFGMRENGRFQGVVSGLKIGANVLEATLPDGRGSRIIITNHPRGGPIFSGPHLEPWECTTDSHGLGAPQDEDCNGDTVVTYTFRNANDGTFDPYDPGNPPPPGDVDNVTIDNGETVRYIRRREKGTLARGIYDIVFLHDPENDPEPTPWTPPQGWNGKFGFSYGSGCAPGFTQNAPEDPLIGIFLDRGYAVAVSSIHKFGNSCNHVITAESTMMIKERMIELLGVDRFSIGNNCSGGAEGQHTVSDNYPGLMDGIRPECTFADGWTPAIHTKADCQLLLNYFNSPPTIPFTNDQQSAVIGANVSMCLETLGFGSGPEDWDPTTGCQIDASLIYDPDTNPGGARCTLQDLNVNYIGTRPDGKAYQVIDYVGIQWGLKALQDGLILLDQFVDMNANMGGYDIDWNHVPERTEAELVGIQRMYDSGQQIWGENQKLVPSIDTRNNNQADFHLNVHREVMRARILRSVGSAESQIHWLEPGEVAFGLPTPPQSEFTLVKMNEWLENIEADSSDDPLEVKVVNNRPADVIDGDCYSGGVRQPSTASCDSVYTQQMLPRTVAGMPLTADILKCQLKPFDPDSAEYSDFGISFSAAQAQTMRDTFPDGVCDWSKPGVAQGPPVGYWLDFSAGPDGVPAGQEPVAQSF